MQISNLQLTFGNLQIRLQEHWDLRRKNMRTDSKHSKHGILQFAISYGSSQAGDWTHWRGPEQTGVSREKDLPNRWSPNPKAENNNLIWKQPYGGRSTPII